MAGSESFSDCFNVTVISVVYKKIPGTHVTKFCFGMTLCALAFLVLYFPQFTATDEIVSG